MRIAIIGADPETKLDAPYGDKSWTLWSCSMRHMQALPDGGMNPDIPRWDAWFELHLPMGLHVQNGQVAEDYAEWLRTQPAVYVRDANEAFSGAIPYPETKMKERFGPYFFTSTIAYMMALAITLEPVEIALWGVGMMGDDYGKQRPGCHYFTQRARELGILVTAPPKCGLLEPPKDQW